MHHATTGGARTRSPATLAAATLLLTACVFALIAQGASLPLLGVGPTSRSQAGSGHSPTHSGPVRTKSNPEPAVAASAVDLVSAPVERGSVLGVGDSAFDSVGGSVGGSAGDPTGVVDPNNVGEPADLFGASSTQFALGPTDVAATVADHTAIVSWHAARSPDPARLSHYRVTSSAGRGCVANSATLTCAIHDLADGVVYRFSVAAVWTTGEAFPSRPANGVIVGTVAPGAPINVFVRPGTQLGTVTVTWTEPMSSGAAPITGWSVTSADVTDHRSRVVTTTDPRGFRRVSCVLERSPNDPRPLLVAARNQFGYGAAVAATASQ